MIGTALLTGAAVAVWQGLSLGWVAYLGVFGFFSVIHALHARRQAQQLSVLGLEVRHGQREQVYDVRVLLNPDRSIRVTRVVALLRSFVSVRSLTAVPESQASETHTEVVFTLTEHLFDGSARLGHGEKLERSGAFELPEKVKVPFPSDREPDLGFTLTILTEVDGAPFSEYLESAQIGLPAEYQVTLSQM